MSRFLTKLAHPPALVAVATVIFCIIGLSNYPVSSFAISTIQPSTNTSQTTPTIGGPVVLSRTESGKTKHKLPKLALSFDDGPNPLTTPRILRILEKEHVKASFFVVGSRVAGNGKLLQRMYEDGFDIGNHSWNHPNFANLSQAQINNQINRTQRVVAAAGVPAPFMFRPPYGIPGSHFPKQLPLAIVLWNIDPRDWEDHSPKDLTKVIVAQAKPGGIIDLHGIYGSTTDALGPAIKKLKKHYRLVTVSNLLGIKPGDTGKFYGYR